MLARGAYVALGQKGAYTRMRGLDRNTNKELLVQHMRDNPAGSRMEEFLQVLPSLSRSQVQVLLRELRADDRAHVIGLKKGARWYLGHRPADLQPA